MRLVPLILLFACEAESPRGSFVFRPDLASSTSALETPPRVLYMNRCAEGCTIYPGTDDSRTNHSSIVPGESQISPFAHGDVVWNQTVRCVQRLYEPFEVKVTDVDPGDVPHVESIVAGLPSEIGFSGIAGVSPFACGVVENGINFNFAGVVDNPIFLCTVVGQESGHTYGLDHQLLCNDPMTYLPACEEKKFRRVDALCGEFEPRECFCGGEIQNSYLGLLKVLGARVTAVDYAPLVEIVAPEHAEDVMPAFRVLAKIEEDADLERAELFIDGVSSDVVTSAPYTFRTPDDLALGEHELRVYAIDRAGQDGEDSVTVTVTPRPPRADAGFFDAGMNPGPRPRIDPDAGFADAAPPLISDSGCTCSGRPATHGAWLLGLVALGIVLRSRRRSGR